MIYHKGATQIDQCAHRLMEYQISPDWHGSTVVGDYIAFYHEEKLFTVRHLKKGVSCLVYARSPYDAIEKVRAMEEPHQLTPKKPKVSVDTWVCPACGRDVEYQVMLGDSIIFHGQHNFCPNCGQAIDWEEPPEEGET